LQERESEIEMHHMFSKDVLHALLVVEGRYIEWEWDPRTLKSDHITIREASGHHVVGHDNNGRAFNLYVVRDVMQRLIGEHSVYEDESKRASGFRVYRPTDQSRSLCELRKTA
jgi:hypothetical protein